jgi:hypothetical protein
MRTTSPFGRKRHKYTYNIKIDRKDIRREVVELVCSTHNIEQWQAFVDTTVNLLVA